MESWPAWHSISPREHPQSITVDVPRPCLMSRLDPCMSVTIPTALEESVCFFPTRHFSSICTWYPDLWWIYLLLPFCFLFTLTFDSRSVLKITDGSSYTPWQARQNEQCCAHFDRLCCLQIVYQGQGLARTAPQGGRIHDAKPKSCLKVSIIHKAWAKKTAGGCPVMMPLSGWVSGSEVRNRQTSVFVPLGRLPAFRERILRGSPAPWDSFLPLLLRIFLGPFQALPNEFWDSALAATASLITLNIFHHFSVLPLL